MLVPGAPLVLAPADDPARMTRWTVTRVCDGTWGTPSTRGAGQPRTLGGLAGEGQPTAVVFVVQRGDALALDPAAEADPGWVAAVRGAAAAGVHLVAYGCEVEETSLQLGRALGVRH